MSQIEELISDWRTRARHCALIHAQFEKKGDTITAKQALTAKEVYMTCARNLEKLSIDILQPLHQKSPFGGSWPIF